MDTPPNPHQAAAKIGGKAKGLGKSLTGHPKWVYIVIIAGAIGAAYYMRKRAAAAGANALTSPDTSATPYGGYGDTTNYPGGTQGAYYGSGTPSETAAPPGLTMEEVTNLLGTIIPALGGGGPPATPSVEIHYVPETPSSGGGNAPPTPEPPPPPPPYIPPPAPAPVPQVTHQAAQPVTGPGIFYNASRNLRYVVQRHANSKTYRHYESALNRGDWGHGGVIPT